MKHSNKNYEKLDQFFDKLLVNNLPIPLITQIKIYTNVSHATISRYAKARGYFSFPEMRATLSRIIIDKSKTNINNNLFQEFLNDNNKIVVFSSVSSRAVATFLFQRLQAIKKDVIFLENFDDNFKNDYSAIAISVSGDSLRVDKFINQNKFNDIILIDCFETKKVKKEIILKEFMYFERNTNDLFKSLIEMNNWIQNEIKVFQEKNIKKIS